MKKWIIESAIFLTVFFISVIVISKILNKGNLDLTQEVAATQNPCAYVMIDGQRTNAMFGYATVMDTETLKEHITPIDESRSVSLEVDTFGTKINKVSYEVRSVDGKRLVENTEVFNYTKSNNLLKIQFAVKNLINENTQYTLVLLLEKGDGSVLRYYTRIIQTEKVHLSEQLQFAKDFHEATFADDASAIVKDHLESNSSGDNTTYAYVNIHSRLSQVNWGTLQIESASKPVYQIVEIGTETASILLHFTVTIIEDGKTYIYPVEEYFRTRYTADRMYLLEYERTMNQLIESSNLVVANDKIMLGISTGEIALVENISGTIVSFVENNALYSFSVADNKLAVIYSPYETGEIDYRTTFSNQEIRVLSVSEAGNITYMIYGHLSQGEREGHVGIQIMNYDSTTNTIQEKVFIPYTKSESILMAEIGKVSYINSNNVVFFFLSNNLYRVDLDEAHVSVVAKDVLDINYVNAEDCSMLVWQIDEEEKVNKDPYACSQLLLYNLSTEEKTIIQANADSYIMPLGFMGKDLIYGEAKKTQITTDYTGKTIFPMYFVRIQDEDGSVLKEYKKDSIYITGIEMENNLITLKRLKEKEDGSLLVTTDDQIISSEIEETGKNVIITVATENYEKIQEISLTKSVTSEKTLILTPKEVIKEGDRTIELTDLTKDYNRYYVRTKDGVIGIFTEEAKAVSLADSKAGVVTDDSGAYVWKSGNRLVSNQIMAIGTDEVSENRNSVAVCLESILSFEGITVSTERRLQNGESVVEILKSTLPGGSQVLELSGCSLSAALYYVSEEYPIMAVLKDGTAVLIVGYNQQNTVIMDPKKGTTAKKGMNDSKAWFEENGNVFITYIQE